MYHLDRIERLWNRGQPITSSEAKGLRNLSKPTTSSEARGLRNFRQPTTSSQASGLRDFVNLEGSERLNPQADDQKNQKCHQREI